MTTIKYALREVRKYFGRYLPIYAQIITSVLLFAFIAVTFDQARVFSAKMYEYSLDSRINMTRLVPQLRVLHKSQPA